MSPKVKVWSDPKRKLFHDECFDEDESREGYDPVDLNDVDDDEVCDTCGGPIFAGPEDDDDGDDEEGGEG